MHLIKVRHVVIGALLLTLTAVTADSSFAQTPGAPEVTVLPDNSVIVTYAAPVTPPAGTVLVATHNGVPIGPFPIGTSTTISSGIPLPAGVYAVQIVWGNGVASPVTTFTIEAGTAPVPPPPAPPPVTAPGATIMHPAIVSGTTVTVSWDPIPGAAGYELEAILFESGQRFSLVVAGSVTSLVVPDVSFGNYMVRVRGLNAAGPGPYSNQVLVSIGTSVRLRDLEVTLTWNTGADLDLHIIEPDGTHVYWNHRRGRTVRLEGDVTSGFGPETAIVDVAGAVRGIYQIYIVHYRGAFPTTATVSVTLNSGSSNAQTMLFTRQTPINNSTRGFNVALVDVRSGIISEAFGTRSVLAEDVREVKPQ